MMKSKNMMYRLTVSSCLVVFLSSNALASHSSHPVNKQPHSTLDITRYLDHDVIDHEKENYVLMAQARAARKVPKNVKGKLTFKQKLNFKLKKRKLNKKKSEAKKTLKEANAAKKITDKALKRAAKRATDSRNNLNKKRDNLQSATDGAKNRTGITGVLARGRVRLMKLSYDRAVATHANGPKAAHTSAFAKAKFSNEVQLTAKNNLGRIRADLAVRKQQKNNARAKNLQQAQAKKLAKQDKSGAKPVGAANLRNRIYDRVPPLPQNGSRIYDRVPPLRQNGVSHYTKAPPSANTIYNTAPALPAIQYGRLPPSNGG